MSKIKEQMMRSNDLQMDYYAKFMDFVYDNLVSVSLNEQEINEMEQEAATSNVPSLKLNLSVPNNPSNNTERRSA